MVKIDLTYGGKLKALVNVLYERELNVNYTIDGKTGKPTTTSIMLSENGEELFMITFDYQQLKKLLEGSESDGKRANCNRIN